MNIVPRGQNNAEPKGPGAQFVRINFDSNHSFRCTTSAPAGYFNATYGLMAAAYKLKLIPDIVLPGQTCNGKPFPKEDWLANSKYCITHMADAGSALQNAYYPLPPTYFEVGNEPNE